MKEEISSLTNMPNLSAFTISLSEGMGETAEYPVVAQFGEIGLSKKSPTTAPNGLINTNAAQNKNVLEILVK